jgi:hypothetical protein
MLRLGEYSSYFTQREDVLGRLGLSPLQKCTIALRLLAYESATDLIDEYLKLAISTADSIDEYLKLARSTSLEWLSFIVMGRSSVVDQKSRILSVY